MYMFESAINLKKKSPSGNAFSFVIISQVLSVQSTKKYVTILITIVLHYAPKLGQVLMLTFRNQNVIRKGFIKFAVQNAGF